MTEIKTKRAEAGVRASLFSTGANGRTASRRVLLLASVSLGAMAAPNIAAAQLPTGCTRTDPPNGPVIDCVAAAPPTIDGFETNIDDLTINIGADDTPTTVTGGVGMDGESGTFTLNIAEGSTVGVGEGGEGGVNILLRGGSGGVILNSAGSIGGGSDQTYAANVTNQSSGDTSVTVVDVTTPHGSAMRVLTSAAGGATTVSSTGVLDGEYGVGLDVDARGAGDATVLVDSVYAGDGAGVSIRNSVFQGENIYLKATGEIISEGDRAVSVTNFQDGNTDLLLTSVASRSGEAAHGVYVDHQGTAGDVTVRVTDAVNASYSGIYVTNVGAGDTVIDVNTVEAAGYGVLLNAGGEGTDDASGVLSITADGTIDAYQTAIQVESITTGDVDIDVATVVSNNRGLDLYIREGDSGGGDVTVETGAIESTLDGVRLKADTDQAISVTTGDVTVTGYEYDFGEATTYGVGVNVVGRNASAISVVTGAVKATYGGIRVTAGGALDITTASVDITGADPNYPYEYAIGAFGSGAHVNVTATGDIVSTKAGVRLANYGEGATTVSVAGVQGGGGESVSALVSVTSGDNTTDTIVTITGAVSGAAESDGVNQGVGINSKGTGDVIVKTASVTAAEKGIQVLSGAVVGGAAQGGDVLVEATGAVSGGAFGVGVRNNGLGATTVTVGDVAATGTETNDAAIAVVQGGNLNFENDGGYGGAYPEGNAGATGMTITATGVASAAGGAAVLAKNYANGDMAITINNAEGTGAETAGVRAHNLTNRDTGASTGDLTIAVNGAINATGDGVYAYNNGGVTNVAVNDIASEKTAIVVNHVGEGGALVTVNGVVIGGADVEAGLRVSGGADNQIANNGSISAASGVAIEGGAGAETLVNTGTLTGAVALADGNDVVELQTGGEVSVASFNGGAGTDTFRLAGTGADIFAAGAVSGFELFEKTGDSVWRLIGRHAFTTSADIVDGVLDLQGTLASPVVTNSAGTLAIGGVNVIGTGTIDGNFVQQAGGDLLIDLDLATGDSDLLSITGAAALAGTVTPADFNEASDDLEFIILTADGGVTDNGLQLNDFASPLVEAALIFPNANEVGVSVRIAFTPPDVLLNEDQAALAANLGSVFDAGGADGALGAMFDALFFNIDDAEGYVGALDQLSPDVFVSTQTAGYEAAVDFSGSLFSCEDKTDAQARSREGECLWLRVNGGILDIDSDGGTIGFNEETVGVTAGWQFEVAQNLQVGIAGGFEAVTIDADNGARSEGERYLAGVSVKHQRGPLRLAAALSGGMADFDTTRTVSFGGLSESLWSTQDVNHAAAELRVAYQLDIDDRWYARPFADAAVTWVDIGDVVETGGSTAMTIDGEDQTFLSVTPGIEFGAEIALNDAIALKPFLRAGATFVDNTALGMSAAFVNAPSGAGPFAEGAAIDDRYADIQAGMTSFNLRGGGPDKRGRFGELGSRASISLVYEGRHGENTKKNSAFIKAAFPF